MKIAKKHSILLEIAYMKILHKMFIFFDYPELIFTKVHISLLLILENLYTSYLHSKDFILYVSAELNFT